MKIGTTSALLLAVASIFRCATSSVADTDQEKLGRVKLNHAALAYAKELINEGRVVLDRKGAWAKDKPSIESENEFIRQHGFSEYTKWHLGIDERYAENTKRRYKFPYGDFKNVHRCGALAVKARARQYNHADIESAATELISLIEGKRSESGRAFTHSKTLP